MQNDSRGVTRRSDPLVGFSEVNVDRVRSVELCVGRRRVVEVL